MPAKRLGKDATFNDNTGSFGTPAWRAHKWIRDIVRNEDPGGKIDATDRFHASVTNLTTRYKLSYDIDGIWQANTSQTALRTAFLAGSVLDLAVLDRISTATSPSSGLGHRGECLIKKFSLEFPLNGEQKLSITVVPHGNYASGQSVVTYTDATTVLGTADAAGTRKLGKTGSINNAAGTPLTGIRDFKLNLEWVTANASDRASEFELEVPTQMQYTVECEFAWDANDTTLTAIRTAYNAHSALATYFVLDGAYATSGSWGLNSDFVVTKFAYKGPLKDLQLYSVTLEPRSNATTLPTFVTI